MAALLAVTTVATTESTLAEKWVELLAQKMAVHLADNLVVHLAA